MPRPILEFDLKTFGKHVLRFRKARRLSIEQMSRQYGVQPAAHQRIEQAIHPNVTARHVLAAARATQLNPLDYLKEKEQPK